MDRSKRAIKTPKRYDDEAFETPPKHQAATKPAAANIEVAEQPPEAASQSKSIIKVKLSKMKPREGTRLSEEPAVKPKETPKVKEPVKPRETLKIKMTPRSREPKPIREVPVDLSELANDSFPSPVPMPETTPRNKESKSLPTKLKEATAIPNAQELPVRTGQVGRPRDPNKRRESVSKVSKESAKFKDLATSKPREPGRPPKETPKPKELPPPLPPPPILQDREIQLIHRPRMKRPRTPPIYTDLIPNVVLPFWDARTAAEDHEDDNVKELVHCQCGIMEELGLMIQCETCLTWQHAHCLNMEKAEDVPDGYTCRACAAPKFARESMKWAYDQDWLTKGRMKQFHCDSHPLDERQVNILQRINQLIGHSLNIHQLIRSLRVKNRILMNTNDDDPELKLFRMQWPANYQHHDGSHFIPTVNNPSSTPASTISVIGETSDPGDIVVENGSDAGALPDIGPLEDVSAILDNTYVPPNSTHESPSRADNDDLGAVERAQGAIDPNHDQQQHQNQQQPHQHQSTMANSNVDATPIDCRTNLRLHIQQTEEFIGIELAHIEEQLAALEEDCASSRNSKLETSLESLKNDLHTMRKYIALNKQWEY